jgi:hypothetical protein
MPADSENDRVSEGSWWRAVRECSGTREDQRNQYWFVAATLVWAVTFVGARMLFKHSPDLAGPAAWLVAGVPVVFSVVALLVYLRFLRMADELVRRIQLEGLALGVGAGVVFAMGWSSLELAGAPKADVGDAASVMMIAWSVGTVLAMRRYR